MSTAVIYFFIFLSALALALSLFFVWRCLRALFDADGEDGPDGGRQGGA